MIKVSELIEMLKTMPQDLPVFVQSQCMDYDYVYITNPPYVVKNSEVCNEESDEPEYKDICVIGEF